MPANSKNTKSSNKETSVPAPAPVEAKAEPKTKKVAKTETVAPTIAPTVAPTVPVVQATPATQKGAGKAKVTKTETTPTKVEVVVPAKTETVAPAKATKAKATTTTTTTAVVAKAVPAQKAGAKKVAPKAKAVEKIAKQPKVAKKAKAETEADAEGEDIEKGVRSFKVQLPGNEEFTGRFTGLTPYQAANKALSKYFRENKTAKTEISFSIRESTRGSKRSTYTYNGKREKLETPVKYSIKGPDGNAREIVKEYKNKLTKVKKSETKEATA